LVELLIGAQKDGVHPGHLVERGIDRRQARQQRVVPEATDERALLIAIPLRHLESLAPSGDDPVLLPAGGPGALDTAPAGLPVYVVATDAGDDEVPAATWRARYVGSAPYEPDSPWPDGLPDTWVAEHDSVPAPDSGGARAAYEDGLGEDRGDDWDDDWGDDWGDDWDEFDEDDDDLAAQAFLVVSGLQQLPRESWLFTNELVRKQARRGRSFRPRVPTLVDLPD
jgi:hypothetical protein